MLKLFFRGVRRFIIGVVGGLILAVVLLWGALYFFFGGKSGINKEEVVAKLEHYKMTQDGYPENLELINLKENEEYGYNIFTYTSDKLNFRLCHYYAPIVGAKASCYDSQFGKWEIVE